MQRFENRIVNPGSRSILITGGASFIGANLAARLLTSTDARITIFDTLAQAGSERNLAWLQSQAIPGHLDFVRGDVCNMQQLRSVVRNADEIYHLASPGHGTSRHPAALRGGAHAGKHGRADGRLVGTRNVLQAARSSGRSPLFVYISSAKIYGRAAMPALLEGSTRFYPADRGFRGIAESAPCDPQTPAAAAMAAAEQSVQDYAGAYDLPTITLRVDTVCGPRQFANQDHGWVAHFVDSILSGRPVRVFGSGLQVHDVLHISDLVDALMAARAYAGVTAGKVYNVGGGMTHTASVLEVIELIQRLCYTTAIVEHEAARAGDVPFYAADYSRFEADTGWMPRRSLEQTIRDIAAFWHARRSEPVTSRPVARHTHRHPRAA